VEFTLNSTIQDGTQQTPMKLISGHEPILPITFLNPQAIQFQSQSLEEFMTSRSNAIASAKDNLKLAQDYMAAYANQSRQDVQFDVGDMVFVHNNAFRTPLERTQTCNKFKSVRHGPYRVEKVVSSVAYKLIVPRSLSRIHNVFQLKKYHERSDLELNPPEDLNTITNPTDDQLEKILRTQTTRAGRAIDKFPLGSKQKSFLHANAV
jgi:hypothetical protein